MYPLPTNGSFEHISIWMRQNRIIYSRLASNSPSSASLVLGLLKGPKTSKTTQTHKGPCKERSLSKEEQKLTTQGQQVRVRTDCVPKRSSQQVSKQKPHKHLRQVTVPFPTNQDSGIEASLGTLFRQPGYQNPGSSGEVLRTYTFLTFYSRWMFYSKSLSLVPSYKSTYLFFMQVFF